MQPFLNFQNLWSSKKLVSKTWDYGDFFVILFFFPFPRFLFIFSFFLFVDGAIDSELDGP